MVGTLPVVVPHGWEPPGLLIARELRQIQLLGRASVPVMVVWRRTARSLLMVPVAAARGIQCLRWWVVALPAGMRILHLQGEEQGDSIQRCHGPNPLDCWKSAFSTRLEALKFLCGAHRSHPAAHFSLLQPVCAKRKTD